jgi:MoaA/NifB/PqqE/SkfB family radical SAM enzyme
MASTLTKDEIDESIDRLIFKVEEGKVYYEPTENTPTQINEIVSILLGFLNLWKTVGEFQGGAVHYAKMPPFPTPVGIRELKNLAHRLLLNEHFPTHIKLDLTYRCQSRCLHCGCSSKYNPAGKELSTEEWKRVIDDCISLGVTQFHVYGGEPLLRNDVVEIIQHIDKTKAICNIGTNGLLVTEKLLKQLKEAGLFFLAVSIDYPDPDAHDKNRRVKGYYNKITDAVKMARDMGIFVEIDTFMAHGEIATGKFEKMVGLAKELSAHVLTIIDYHPAGQYTHNIDPILSDEEKKFMLGQAMNLMNQEGPVVAFYFFQTDEEVCDQLMPYPPIADIIAGCPAARKFSVISAYGDVLPCAFSPFTFGNIRIETIGSIYERMLSTPPYDRISVRCRLLDPVYRRKYINQLDALGLFPVPFPGLKERLPIK